MGQDIEDRIKRVLDMTRCWEYWKEELHEHPTRALERAGEIDIRLSAALMLQQTLHQTELHSARSYYDTAMVLLGVPKHLRNVVSDIKQDYPDDQTEVTTVTATVAAYHQAAEKRLSGLLTTLRNEGILN